MAFRKNPVNFRKFISYYKPYKKLLIADLFSSVMVAALGLTLPLCVRYITNDILSPGAGGAVADGMGAGAAGLAVTAAAGADGMGAGANASALPGILLMGAAMIAIIAAKTAFGLFYDYKGHDMGAKIERDLRGELFEHFQKLSFNFYDNRNTGELMSRMSDLMNLAEIYHHVPEMILIDGIQIIGAAIILFHINWQLASVVFLILPIIAAYSVFFYRKLQRAYKVNREYIADINAAVQDNLSGIRVVKSFANEETEIKKFSARNLLHYKSRSGIYKSEALLYSAVEHFFTPLITVAIAVAGGIGIAGGYMTLANLLMFIMYAAYLTSPIPALASVIPFYQQGWSGYIRFMEIMDMAPDIRDAENAAEMAAVKGNVVFENVSFRYSKDSEYVLHNINLSVSPGETVAVVGHSGIGKTTLCSLIPRFYDTTDGDIRIDGTSVSGVTLKSLRRQIGVVRQETFLFAGTVMENILYGNPEATAEEAVNAAKKANAHEFIMQMPNGYDTDIGQRGVKLSGGQQQRLSIARVFLKNPPILIFDEATSALDSESERVVMDSLKTLSEGRTTFIIAHRLSTIRNAGRIIVITDEGITEQGTHEELYAADGDYAKLFNMQDV